MCGFTRKKLTFPKRPLNTLHNAIPLKLSEIKTCYNIVKNITDMQMSVFQAQQMRQYSLLFRIFTDFTLSTQKTEKSTVHFHTEFQVYKDALPKLEIMIYSALIPVPMAEAPRPAAMKSKLWNHSFLIHAHMKIIIIQELHQVSS